ncbi:MAG: hypothetical protein K7J46_17050 [Bryobacter sp.]|jgi:hypothetical protein|nr:hypothetical protein [Bryobacter sp. CoA8 C33]
MKAICTLFLAAALLRADARYALAYRVKTNPVLTMVAALAGLDRLNSDGEEVLLKDSRVMVRGKKTSVVVNYGSGLMLLIDHQDKTWEQLRIEEMSKRLAADIPDGLIQGLKRLFPGGGGGVAIEVIPERVGLKPEQRTVREFRKKYGLGYLLPAMGSLVRLVPSLDSEVDKLDKSGAELEALRIRVGLGGKLVDGFVEMLNYRESPVEEAEMRPPADYAEVK